MYYPDKTTLNTAWYTKYWQYTVAYGNTVPSCPETNGTSSITLPSFDIEGKVALDIGLTGSKREGNDHDKSNAINYISGMTTHETGGTPGQGNSPSYGFGVTAQRYATVKIESTDTEVTGGFKFTKKNATTGKPIANAEYTLYKDKECTEFVGGHYTTDINGVIEEGYFAFGTY